MKRAFAMMGRGIRALSHLARNNKKARRAGRVGGISFDPAGAGLIYSLIARGIGAAFGGGHASQPKWRAKKLRDGSYFSEGRASAFVTPEMRDRVHDRLNRRIAGLRARRTPHAAKMAHKLARRCA